MRVRHWSLSWARLMKSKPFHPISLRSILILSSHLGLGVLSGPFFQAFPPKSSMHYSSLPCVLYTLPISPSLLDHSNYKAPHYATFSNFLPFYLLGSNNLLSTLFSNTLSLCSSLNVSDQVAHPSIEGNKHRKHIYKNKNICKPWNHLDVSSDTSLAHAGLSHLMSLAQLLQPSTYG
jgi:hypothetical protein